ncbi:hypothetical protein A2U01_0057208, partial [Trifolium medium]|nr:hypothetical protein [Trifolium medium]
ARLVRPDGGRGLFDLVLEAVAVVGMMGLSAIWAPVVDLMFYCY